MRGYTFSGAPMARILLLGGYADFRVRYCPQRVVYLTVTTRVLLFYIPHPALLPIRPGCGRYAAHGTDGSVALLLRQRFTLNGSRTFSVVG